VIFPSDRPPHTTQICVFLADLLDPKLDPTDLCSLSTSCTDFHLRIFYVRSSPTGEDLNNFHFFECGHTAASQPLSALSSTSDQESIMNPHHDYGASSLDPLSLSSTDTPMNPLKSCMGFCWALYRQDVISLSVISVRWYKVIIHMGYI